MENAANDFPEIKKNMGLRRAICLVCVIVVATVALWLRTEKGRFYSTIPSMSWDEFNDIKNRAEQGDAEAQLYYGIFYANGDGVDQDYAKAISWYDKSATADNPRAMRNMALLYECGLGVTRDYQKAFDLYWRAAELGDVAAHFGVAGYCFSYREKIKPLSLGSYNNWRLKAFYLLGLKIDHDLLETSFWKQYKAQDAFYQDDHLIVSEVRRQAESDTTSQMRMALFYFQGQGVRQNFTSMGKWVLEAAQNNDPRAKFLLAMEYTNTNTIFPRLENDQIYEQYLHDAAKSKKELVFVQAFAEIYLEDKEQINTILTLVEQGYTPALKHYKLLLGRGYGNSELYEERLIESAAQGDGNSIRELAAGYANGRILPLNYQKSVIWIEHLLSLPSSEYIFNFRSNLAIEHGEPADPYIEWHYERAKGGNSTSQLIIALFYDRRQKHADNEIQEYIKWSLKASRSGSGLGFYLIGNAIRRRYTTALDQKTLAQIDALLLNYLKIYDDLKKMKSPIRFFFVSAKLGFFPGNIAVCDLQQITDDKSLKSFKNSFDTVMTSSSWYFFQVVEIRNLVKKYLSVINAISAEGGIYNYDRKKREQETLFRQMTLNVKF